MINNYDDLFTTHGSGSVQITIPAETLKAIQIPIPKTDALLKEWTIKLSVSYNDLNIKLAKCKEYKNKTQIEIQRIIDEEKCEQIMLKDLCEYIKMGKNKTPDDKKRICGINFLYEIIKLFSHEIEKNSNGSVIKGISKMDLENIELPIPKDKTLIEKLESQFKQIEQLEQEIKDAKLKYKDLLKQLNLDTQKKTNPIVQNITKNVVINANENKNVVKKKLVKKVIKQILN